jgi:NADH:ubiquinone oxidoreductase subunit K
MTPVNISFMISGILFALGLLIFCIRRSFWASLLSILFIWTGAVLNLLVVSHDGIGGLSGQGAAVLLAILAGLEACVALGFRWSRKLPVPDSSDSCK